MLRGVGSYRGVLAFATIGIDLAKIVNRSFVLSPYGESMLRSQPASRAHGIALTARHDAGSFRRAFPSNAYDYAPKFPGLRELVPSIQARLLVLGSGRKAICFSMAHCA